TPAAPAAVPAGAPPEATVAPAPELDAADVPVTVPARGVPAGTVAMEAR
ncbi:acetyl-CoA carboxylase biotin carboxyl carrier protein subunit, partial [Micromonospora sp. S4605]